MGMSEISILAKLIKLTILCNKLMRGIKMEIINQTNRTILFEEINPDKDDLITLVGDVKGIDSLNDEKVKEINQQLLVKSFDEFLEKFSPCGYFPSTTRQNQKGMLHAGKRKLT
jgi:hypothetical protein